MKLTFILNFLSLEPLNTTVEEDKKVKSTVTLTNVNKDNEVPHNCVFVFTDPQAKNISSDAVTPDILGNSIDLDLNIFKGELQLNTSRLFDMRSLGNQNI